MIPEARVRFTSGGTTYEATFNLAVVLCAPKADYPECPSTLSSKEFLPKPPLLRELERLRKGGGLGWSPA